MKKRHFVGTEKLMAFVCVCVFQHISKKEGEESLCLVQ